MTALRARLACDAVFRQVLAACHARQLKLLHFERGGAESYWGGCLRKSDGKQLGQNRLGQMMMELAPQAAAAAAEIETAGEQPPQQQAGAAESTEQAKAKAKARKRLGKKLAEIAKLKLKRQQQPQQQLQPNQLAKIAQEGQLREELRALETHPTATATATATGGGGGGGGGGAGGAPAVQACIDEGVALVRTRSAEERALRAVAEQEAAAEARQHTRIDAKAGVVAGQIETLQAELGLAAAPPQQQKQPQQPQQPQPYDYYCVIDFEATCEEHQRIQPQEIIELPSVLLESRTMTVVDEFQLYVRPVHRPRLTEFCTQLTGIQQACVDEGTLFGEALQAHTEWLRGHGIAVDGGGGRSMICVSCGDWDLKTMLPAQLRLDAGGGGERGRVPLHLRRWINIKHTYTQSMGQKASGMVSMLDGLGLTLEGRHHSGIDDCRNLAKVVQALAQRGVTLECTATTVKGETLRRPTHSRLQGGDKRAGRGGGAGQRGEAGRTSKRGGGGGGGGRGRGRGHRRYGRLQ